MLCQLIGGIIASLRHKSPADGADVGMLCWAVVFSIWAFVIEKQITVLPLDKQNRMLRAGFGKHDGSWFLRIDLWWVGFRLSR